MIFVMCELFYLENGRGTHMAQEKDLLSLNKESTKRVLSRG